MINFDSDADSDLLTVTAKPKVSKNTLPRSGKMPSMKAAEKYEKIMKERARREKELKH